MHRRSCPASGGVVALALCLPAVGALFAGSGAQAGISAGAPPAPPSRERLETVAALQARAWDIVRRQGEFVVGDEARRAFSATNTHYADSLIATQVNLGQVEAAFRTLQESRGSALRQLLATRDLSEQTVPDETWRRYRETLEAQFAAEAALDTAWATERGAGAAIERARARGRSAPYLDLLRGPLAAAREVRRSAEGDRILARLRTQSRWQEVLRAADRTPLPPVLPLAELRRVLAPGDLHLAYAVTGGESTLFVVPGNPAQPIAAYPIARSGAALRRDTQEFLALLIRPDSSPDEVADRARRLTSVLLPEPVAAAVRKARRLIFSPDGPLWEAPFAALVFPGGVPPRSSRAAPVEFLGRARPISVTPSLAVLAALRQPVSRSEPRKRDVLVLSGPQRDALAHPAAGSPADPPASSREVARIHDVRPFPSLQEEGAELRPRLSRARIIHFGGPVARDPDRALGAAILLAATSPFPGNAAVPLAPSTPPGNAAVPTAPSTPPGNAAVPAAPRPRPGNAAVPAAPPATHLSAWELAGLRLNADLVCALSGPGGRGEIIPGEGVVGLPRAFLGAGARSMATALWDTRPDARDALALSLHRHLRARRPSDEALRQAADEVARDARWQHPHYWAGALLWGNPTAAHSR